MSVFNDERKDAQLATIEALTDLELLAQWLTTGAALATKAPADFLEVFGICVRAFSDTPPSVRQPTLNNWTDLGTRLITTSAQNRHLISATIVQAMSILDGPKDKEVDGNMTSERAGHWSRSLTFSRAARVAEEVVIQAEMYVKDNPDADEFYIELDSQPEAEAEALQASHPDLIRVAVAMSLTEWSFTHPHVEHIEVIFGEHMIDVPLRQKN